jgi:hypothetical protein
MLIVLSAVLALGSCKARSQRAAPGVVTTQTVAPAAAQPAPAGNDAMTQTVNVDDGRSDDEGPAGTDTTANAATKAPKASKVAKKHR